MMQNDAGTRQQKAHKTDTEAFGERSQLYLDMDGVLADFDKRAWEVLGMHPKLFEDHFGTSAFWRRLYDTPDFFYTFDPMPDASLLLERTAHLNPIVLTGVPRGEWAAEQKRRWIRDKLSPDLEVITCPSRNKRDYCKPGDILIDDRAQYRHLWEEAGGIFILHTSAEASLAELESARSLSGGER